MARGDGARGFSVRCLLCPVTALGRSERNAFAIYAWHFRTTHEQENPDGDDPVPPLRSASGAVRAL